MTILLKTRDDLQWLKEAHLKDLISDGQYERVHSAVISGNEDCPEAVELYCSKNPMMNEKPEFTFERNSEGDLAWKRRHNG
jgi:hypothetical protein